jgi:predicted nucleotidyltransferase
MGASPSELAAAVAGVLARDTGESLASAYLFGSHAEGRPHRESDVDVGILLRYDRYPTERERFEEGLRLASLLGGVVEQARLDLVVLNDAPPGLAARVVTTGRRLVCADREADHAFRRDVQLRAADLEPFLRRARAIKLEALGR